MHESLRTQRCVQLCNQVQSHTVYDHLLKCIQTAGLALFDTCCALEATKKKLHVFRCVRCPNNLAQRCWPIYFQPNHSRHLALLTRGRLASSEKGGDCATPTVTMPSLLFSRGKWPESPPGGSVVRFTQRDDDFLEISLGSGLFKRADSIKKKKVWPPLFVISFYNLYVPLVADA